MEGLSQDVCQCKMLNAVNERFIQAVLLLVRIGFVREVDEGDSFFW